MEINEDPFRQSSSGTTDHPHLARQSGMAVTARVNVGVNEVPSVYAVR